MTRCVFVGPTLRTEEVLSILPDAVCLPPVAQGDVFRVARQQPDAIGIIDGYFSGAPSVWHKEILWALSQGVPVFGSASMGALRAAELHDFGMVGVGRIFAAYRGGDLEDDDEVAVVHGPPETGFMAASEPMVNMRATLARAEAAGTISGEVRLRLEATAKSLFFPHRTWPAVFNAVTEQGMRETELAALRDWLPGGSVDQKREDALAMLAAMKNDAVLRKKGRGDFRFERTNFWDDLVRRLTEETTRETETMPDGILDEVRLLGPDTYRAVMKNALARLLAERESLRRDFTPPPGVRAAITSEHREDRGLYLSSQLNAWMESNGLDQPSFDRLMEQEALLRQFTEASAEILTPYLLDELRMSGRYNELATRARDKAARFGTGPDLQGVESPNSAQLLVWYFESHLERPIPEDVGAFVAALGFEGAAEFYRALHREWMYARPAAGGVHGSDREADRRPPK